MIAFPNIHKVFDVTNFSRSFAQRLLKTHIPTPVRECPIRLFSRSVHTGQEISTSETKRLLQSRNVVPDDASDEWERKRLMWLGSGEFKSPGKGRSAILQLRRCASIVQAARFARIEKKLNSKPVEIRKQSIMNALREPTRMVEFNRGMPLASMVEILRALWEEELECQAGIRPRKIL